MEVPRQHRHPVDFQGDGYIVCTERDGRAIRVWIERASEPGRRWCALADGLVPIPGGKDQQNEFAVTLGADASTAEQVAMASGLFQRTGRSLEGTGRKPIALWSFSSASPLRIRAVGDADTRPLRDPLGLEGKDIPALMRYFADTVEPLGVMAILVTGPDLAYDDPECRALVAGAPAALATLDPQLFASAHRRLHPAAEWGPLEQAPFLGASRLIEMGYRSWISVRISVPDGHHYEIVQLGPDAITSPEHAPVAVATATNMIAPLRRAAVASLKISARELEVLRYGALQVKETAEILERTVSTVKFHRDNVRHKIGGASMFQAYLRAQKLGVFD